MATASQKDKVEVPPSQKTAPKKDETGTIKDTKGDSLKADESVNTKSSKSKESEPEPIETSNVKVEGEVLQGDSFRINVTRGPLTMHIPVPIEGTNNVTVISNALKLVEEALEAKTEKEMRDKFGSLVA